MNHTTNALRYLRKIGFNSASDLNYTTKDGVEFHIGTFNTTAVVVAIIENDDDYMLSKTDAIEMSDTARTKGIKHVELHTNFGIELHSRYETPQSIGFDRIVKNPFE